MGAARVLYSVLCMAVLGLSELMGAIQPACREEAASRAGITTGWRAISNTGAPPARSRHTAVWTGTEMIVFGGIGEHSEYLDDGGRYNPATDVWIPLPPAGAPSSRTEHTAIWTGTEMIIWGGLAGDSVNDGARYAPAANSWLPIPTGGAPSTRYDHTAVWTGTEMIVWGGTFLNDDVLGDGAATTHPPTVGLRYQWLVLLLPGAAMPRSGRAPR